MSKQLDMFLSVNFFFIKYWSSVKLVIKLKNQIDGWYMLFKKCDCYSFESIFVNNKYTNLRKKWEYNDVSSAICMLMD